MSTEESHNTKVTRRLAAILAADIAGYSALMGSDEEATVLVLKAHQAVVLPMIGEHGGRIIDTAGDGILAEFASILGAVKCAVAIQKTMAERNTAVDPVRQMQFRIGINQGDVVFDDARVYGDGVNVAARLEAIAEPGGICISDKVYAEITGKIDTICHDLGPQQLKNIATPVRVYRVELRNNPDALPLREKMALSLPDKPSLAVLPFTNLSGDPSQDYFSDGISEDIITELSRFSELFVIARNSSFTYKGRAVDVRQVGRELGVRYVLEGSIRRAGDRVRITGQLIDATTGAHRWAERYDRKLEDVFEVQDEVARTITSILAAHVNKAEVERTLLKPPATWQAHDYYMRAAHTLTAFFNSFNAGELYEARRLLAQCLSMDPNHARAHAKLASTYVTAWVNPLDKDHLSHAVLDKALQEARKAIQLDPNLPGGYAELGNVFARMQEYEQAIAGFEKATSLNPNFTDWRFAGVLVYAGQLARALEVAKASMRLDPFYAVIASQWLGNVHYLLRQYDEAELRFRECVSRGPNFVSGYAWLAATYAQLGKLAEARSAAAEVMRIYPKYTIDGTQRKVSVFKRPEDVEHLVDGLRKAGLPE